MNGRNERLIVLDSNVVIDFINCNIAALPESGEDKELSVYAGLLGAG
ncbi:MAG: hypothetical protein LBC67_04930 [Spirochaetales bacterium]|jgi:hypothetical protein|nr:hypothetical protein [Spirochaetales bacterium]